MGDMKMRPAKPTRHQLVIQPPDPEIRVPFSTYLVTTVAFVHGHHYK